MNKLWCATSMLAQNKTLRSAVKQVAKNPSGALPAPPFANAAFQRQPDPAALASIVSLFNAQGLYLCLFDSAEINRWMDLDNQDSGDATKPGKGSTYLDGYWSGLAPVFAGIPAAQEQYFLEIVGMLLVDEPVRYKFKSSTLKLADRGYTVAPKLESQLRSVMQTVDNAAHNFVVFSWPAPICTTRMDYYAGYIHVDM
jgi:hypothetical protein